MTTPAAPKPIRINWHGVPTAQRHRIDGRPYVLAWTDRGTALVPLDVYLAELPAPMRPRIVAAGAAVVVALTCATRRLLCR